MDVEDSLLPHHSSYSYSEDPTGLCEGSHHSIIIFNCTLVAFGSLSAIFLIAIIYNKRHLRSAPYTFLNVLFGAFLLRMFHNGIVYTEEAFHPCWRIGRPICMLLRLAEPVLIYSVVVFLIVVAWEQYRRYGTTTSDRGGATVGSKGLHVFTLYSLVLLLSTPDIINALSEKHSPKHDMYQCEINNYHPNRVMYIVLTSKQCFLEYVLPLVVLYVLMAVIVIRMIRSRVTAPTQTPTTTYVNYRPPRYFAMLGALVVAYTVGYFPRYGFMLANLIMRIFLDVSNNSFLGHLQTVDRIFALIPPSFFSLFVLILSRAHLEAGKEMLYRFTVRFSGRGWRSGSMIEANGEDETLNIGMDQLETYSSQS